MQRELRPVEFPPGCKASDKGPATEFGTQKKDRTGFFTNSWCFELKSSARTTSPFVRSDPGRRRVRLEAWRRTKDFSDKNLRKETARLETACLFFVTPFYLFMNYILFYPEVPRLVSASLAH